MTGEKLFDGKMYQLDKVFTKKSDAVSYAKKIREEEWNGWSQLARVEKGLIGYKVYVSVDRNVRYNIPRSAYK